MPRMGVSVRASLCLCLQKPFMDLSKIIAIPGKPGLFKIVAQGRQALIAESFTGNQPRFPVHSSVRVVALDEVSIYTTGEEVRLATVLEDLYAKNKDADVDALITGSVEGLYEKLAEVLPNYDPSRVYSSDVRKIFLWYRMLLTAGLFEEEGKKDKEEAKEAGAKEEKKPKAAAKGKAKAGTKAIPGAKPVGTSKAKAKTTMHKGAQRGS